MIPPSNSNYPRLNCERDTGGRFYRDIYWVTSDVFSNCTVFETQHNVQSTFKSTGAPNIPYFVKNDNIQNAGIEINNRAEETASVTKDISKIKELDKHSRSIK